MLIPVRRLNQTRQLYRRQLVLGAVDGGNRARDALHCCLPLTEAIHGDSSIFYP